MSLKIKTGLISAAALLISSFALSTWAEAKETAVFAGGCFWCVESDFDKVPGVLSTISGYTGGSTVNPSYRQVVSGGTGHIEAVEIKYDPTVISYKKLVEIFFRSVDPTDGGGQFCDRGHSYITTIFAQNDKQLEIAKSVKQSIAKGKLLSKPVVTPIRLGGPFFTAETYHQDYYTKNPVRYKFYRFNCGRDKQVKKVWGKQAYQGIKKD